MQENLILEIASLPLFKNLPKVQLARIVPFVKRKSYLKGEIVCRQREMAKKLYVVMDGAAELVFENKDGESIVVRELHYQAVFGASEVLQEIPYQNSLVASRDVDVSVIELSKSGLFKLLKYNPSLTEDLLEDKASSIERICDYFARICRQQKTSIESVWQTLGLEEKRFVRQTFLLDKFTAEDCKSIFAISNCREMIDRLSMYPQVLLKDNGQRLWEYSELLKLFITQNKIVTEEEIQKQHRLIAEWAAEKENFHISIEHYLAVKEFDQAARCLENLFSSGWYDSDMLSGYKKRFPPDYLDKIIDLRKGEPPLEPAAPTAGERFRTAFRINLGWVLCFFSPIFIYLWATDQAFDWDQKIFLCMVSSAIFMWMFKLVAEYIVSLFIVIGCLTLNIVPAQIILEGFSSGAFFLALSVFGLGAVLMSSGFLYRLSLLILYHLPSTLFWQNLALAIVGTIITPTMPSANGRLALVGPIVMDMNETMGYKKHSKAGVRLSMSAMFGFGLMSNFFLTGKSLNFVLLGLLSVELQNRFNFQYWLIAAFVVGVIVFVCSFILAAVLYRAEHPPRISKAEIKNQLDVLGKLSFSEWVAVTSAVIFLLGVMTSTLHRIRTPWIGVLILFLVLFVGELGKEDFKSKIDWPFLLFLGGLIGFIKAFSHLGLDSWIGGQLTFLGNFMDSNFYLFIIVLSVIIVLIRLVLPATATVALFCAVLIPVAAAKAINPWVVGFCVLVISGGWFFPYQSTFYLTFYDTTQGKMFSDSEAFPFNAWLNLINLLALLASVPYWQALGLLK